MDVPDVRYARAGGVAIAYQVVGDGPVDLVYSPHLCDLAEVRGLYEEGAVETVLEFLRGEVRPPIPDSVLATVLFTDLASSTERAVQLGDRAWKDLLGTHHRLVRP